MYRIVLICLTSTACMRFLKLLLVPIVLVLCTNTAKAQFDGGINTTYTGRMTGLTVAGDTLPLIVGDTMSNVYGVQVTGEGRKIINVVSLSVIEETPHFLAIDFVVRVAVRVDYGPSPSSYSSLTDTLIVTYKKDGGQKYDAKNYIHFSEAEYVRVEVLNIAATPSTIGSFDVEDVLLLQNEMRVTRYFELDDNVSPVTFIEDGSTADELQVTWQWPADGGHNFTQLEWTWLENGLEENYKVGGTLDYELLFRHNATRLDLPYGQDSYKIPLFYDGTGKLYYRIRPVNIRGSGNRSDGPWSEVKNYSFSGHDDSLNWQVRTSYAEEGKRKTVMEYYDGSLRSRQTVTKENVYNTTIAAETFYDYEGRPAIQVLPVPGINSIIRYQANLNLFNTQSLNQNPAAIFDLQPVNTISSVTEPLTAALNNSGAAKYYSPANDELGIGANDHIPDGDGYPYTVTRYTPDGTGRVMAQSGVGPAHKMGSGRETKYYYGTAAQEELDGLFGTEVGNYTHYFKNMVKDANGQMSVSYVDMHGRTIATALAGESPSNLIALDINNASHYPGQAGTTITRNLLDGNTNVEKGNAIEAINTLLVPFTTIYNFRYELQPEGLQLPNCPGASPANLCYDCMYDLEISITDESGEQEPIVLRRNNITLTPDDDCTTPVRPFNGTTCVDNVFEFSYELTPGSYAIRKTLTLSEASLQKYKEMYLSKALCKTEQELIDSVYSVLLSISDCNNVPLSCDSCLIMVGDSVSFRAKYLHAAGLDSSIQASFSVEQDIRTAYQAALANCARLCDTTSSELRSKRALMLADMMPYGGQYATEDPITTDNGMTMYEKYNIFSTTYSGSTQPYYKKPWNPSKALDYYRTPLGIVDEQIHPGGSGYTQLNATEKDAFAGQFVNSWAASLLPHHPEYDRLVYAETNLSGAYNWLYKFNKTEKYDTADSRGYIFKTLASITDPFYSVAPAAYKDSMAKWISADYGGSGLSMWQIARGSVKCRGIIDPTARQTCYASGGVKVPSFADVTTTAQKDSMWVVFRNLYATAREYQLNKYIAATVPVSDEASLISQGYQLRFTSHNQVASQYGWSWYPTSPGSGPAIPPYDPTNTYDSQCSGYIQQWRTALLQCTALADHSQKEDILDEITEGMKQVCIKGSDNANPFGSSTVKPSTPVDGSPRSFEEVVDNVFASYNISRDYYCNPYVIEFPKPYGQGPQFSRELISLIDSCTCERFQVLKAEAQAASYNPASLSSLNTYLSLTYGDTLSQALFNGLQHCGQLMDTTCRVVNRKVFYVCEETPPSCNELEEDIQEDEILDVDLVRMPGAPRMALIDSLHNNQAPLELCFIFCPRTVCDTVWTTYSLPEAEYLPEFLKCGYITKKRCLNCAELSALTADFKEEFNSPYDGGPVFTGTNLSDDDIKKNTLFSRYVNFKTGFQFSWMDYAKAAAAAGCNLGGYESNGGAVQQVICRDTRPLNDTTGMFVIDTPCHRTYMMAVSMAQEIYKKRVEFLLGEFEAKYRAKCMDAKNDEKFSMTYLNKEYHYTLYYYDMAGSLVKTVPPKGARPDFSSGYLADVKADRASGVHNPRPHEYITQYRYNSLGGVIAQQSPDAGVSKFWYDRLGRLVVSQNAQQSIDGKYSYTLYDDLGRITEVGQKPQSTPMTQVISQDAEDLQNWIVSTGSTREQITYTVYDAAYGPGLTPWIKQQRHLRNRVSYTATKNLATDAMFYTASFFTYDIHGNVDTLVQDYYGVTEMQSTYNRMKMLTYDYDLISGKVNMVSYQPDYFDQSTGRWEWRTDRFFHKYTYDAENRITTVETSRDKIMWERDATYSYYKHGPLARTELGQLRVQGVDYAYTLQGWLKGVNSTNVLGDEQYDIGKDGYAGDANSIVAKDVYGFGLHYYDDHLSEQDYIGIGGASMFARPNNGELRSLYNGNIAAMSVNNAALSRGSVGTTNAATLMYNYRYDQLNRIKSMQAYSGLDVINNEWNPVLVNDYAESVSYDPNGNILGYLRNGAPSVGANAVHMDSLSYRYYSNTNRLKQVRDSVGAGNYPEDIDNQSDPDNYAYDAIGNLKTDVSEGITNINWTVYGKIASITKGGNTISYTYDAAGNRITKTANSKTTIYVRDASGNVMSVYEKPAGEAIMQTELHIYGSNRIGIVGKQTIIPQEISISGGYDTAITSTFTRAEKMYELTNHLGNVLVTISDRRQQLPEFTICPSPPQICSYVPGEGGEMIPVYCPCDPQATGEVASYEVDVVSASDYYPFGMDMPGRQYGQAGRYGFNGKERDKDMHSLTAYDYGFRIYNPALGRFLSVDPLTSSYPELTPYQFASNNPIEGVDLDGLEYTSSKEVTIEVIRGMVKLKLANLSTVSQNVIKQSQNGCYDQFRNRISSECPPAGGYDTRIGSISLERKKAAEPERGSILDNSTNSFATKPTTADVGKIPQGIETNKTGQRAGLPDGRVKPRDPTPSALSGGPKGLAIAQLAVMGIEIGTNLVIDYKLSKDEDKISRDINNFKSAAADVNYALLNGMIPKNLQTEEYLSDIINVVLSGESYFKGMDKDHGGENGPKILEVGMIIYNTLSVKRNLYTGNLIRIAGNKAQAAYYIPEKNPLYDAQYVKDNPPLEEVPKE